MPNLRETLAQQVRELSCVFSDDQSSDWNNGKRVGHRLARHAAASLIAESEELARVEKFTKDNAVLVCDGCGRLWVDDSDSDQESCDTCCRFKQRMEWATAQQIEDRDTKLLEQLSTLQAEVEALRAENKKLRGEK